MTDTNIKMSWSNVVGQNLPYVKTRADSPGHAPAQGHAPVPPSLAEEVYKHVPLRAISVPMLLPDKVNARAADFAELWVYNRPSECLAAKTVKQLRESFLNFFLLFLTHTVPMRDIEACKTWLGAETWLGTDTPFTLENLTAWTSNMTKRFARPWHNQLYVLTHNVTFDACLWALSLGSATFQVNASSVVSFANNAAAGAIATGALATGASATGASPYITGFCVVPKYKELKTEAPVIWLVSLLDIDTYQAVPRRRRPRHIEIDDDDTWF